MPWNLECPKFFVIVKTEMKKLTLDAHFVSSDELEIMLYINDKIIGT